MKIKQRLKIDFWKDKNIKSDIHGYMFNFHRIWKFVIITMSNVALIPLIFFAITNYNVTKKSIESDILLRTSRVVSNTKRTISFFLLERKAALNFVIQNNTYKKLRNKNNLKKILEDFKNTIGQFSDISIINAKGKIETSTKKHRLDDINYSKQNWFKEVIEKNIYISDVFLGFRNAPHIVIAIKKNLPDNSFFILRASLDIKNFENLLSTIEIKGKRDAVIINQDGILQTNSKQYGKILTKIPLPVPKYSNHTQVIEVSDKKKNNPKILGYAYIQETPFILLIIKNKKELMRDWHTTSLKLSILLIVSIILILIVIFGTSTYLVNSIYTADKKRVSTLHNVEYSNKMAAIGRLAAGVAHEINNPLAIINEKAGLISDMFIYQKIYQKDEKLKKLIYSIIASVDRCAKITRRLLSFSKNLDTKIEKIELKKLINDVLSFLSKEASYRSIKINIDIADNLPMIESDKGKLQQVFLNLFNNAFAALSDGGLLTVKSSLKNNKKILIEVTDTGHGISEENIKRIFEPFFTTKSKASGTGLGLSITFGLIKELGGTISVKSKVEKGTTFSIILPSTYRG